MGAPELSAWLGEANGKRVEPNECIEQVAFADILLLNKCDLVDAQHLASTEEELRCINPHAQIIRCTKAQVPLERLLNVQAFELNKHSESLLFNDNFGHNHAGDHGHGHGHGHGHA